MGQSKEFSKDSQIHGHEEILTLYHTLIEAWNRRSATDYAALFTENATIIGFDGSSHEGRAGVGRDLAAIFANHQTPPYVTKVRSVRALAPTVVLLTAISGLVPRGKADLDPALNALQTMVAVHTGGAWRIELFQNTPATFHGRPELAVHMTEELRAELHKRT